MSRYIKDSTGKLVKFANKLLYMLEHVYNEGVYYLRTIAGGGTVQNRGLVEDLYKLWEEQGRLDNIKVAILPQAGGVQRTSGIYRFFSRLFNLSLEGIKYTATQLVTNGNFANGTTGWVGAVATIAASNNTLMVSGTGTSLIPSANAGITWTQSNKYYIKVKVRVTNSVCTNIRLRNEALSTLFTIKDNPVANEWYSFSAIYTPNANTVTLKIAHTYADAATSNGKVMEVQDVLTINLTATFGAGNEPSKEVCDVLFADYFDGTKEVQLNDVTQGVANSQPYFVYGAMVNPNGASRSMVHPTVSFGAGDAWSVSILSNINTYAMLVHRGAGVTDMIYPLDSITPSLANIGIRNSVGTKYTFGTNGSGLNFIGKSTLLQISCNGSGRISVYKNGVLVESKTGAVTSFVFQNILGTNTEGFRLLGGLYAYTIESGALTPTQILEEYNLLRSYIPEIATTLIGTDEIATENCQMVATPMGSVIAETTNALPIAKTTDPGFEAGNNGWSPFTTGGNNAVSISRVAGTRTGGSGSTVMRVSGYTSNGTVLAATSCSIRQTFATSSPVGVVKVFKISGWVRGDGVAYPVLTGKFILGTSSTEWQYFEIYINAGSGLTYLGNAGGVIPNTQYTEWDDVQVEELGFANSDEIYTAIYNQTTGTVAQKTSAALLAAAMWRSPDSDLDKQAVFGKLFNGYAAQLLQMDIDAYNVANPSTPWGYHVMTRAEEQALATLDADTLKSNDLWASTNGTNETGLSLLGTGVINADGTYSDFGTKTRLVTGEGYALDVNDDGTSEEITVTTEGGILRLVKDLV